MIELLVFNVNLPDLGMTETIKFLKELPMKNEIKEQFYFRLTSIRNNVVSDVQFTNGKEIDFNPKV